MATARAGLTSFVLGDCLYASGGYNGSRLNTVERYDVAADTWSAAPSMDSARCNLGACTVGVGGAGEVGLFASLVSKALAAKGR